MDLNPCIIVLLRCSNDYFVIYKFIFILFKLYEDKSKFLNKQPEKKLISEKNYISIYNIFI